MTQRVGESDRVVRWLINIASGLFLANIDLLGELPIEDGVMVASALLRPDRIGRLT